MNRKIKFRGQKVDNKQWVYGYYCERQNDRGEIIESIILEEAYEQIFNGRKLICSELKYECNRVIPKTVGQYTRLKDNTKWEELTEKEQLDFYNKNKSEDGITIKYRNINDVKHLWKGKEIYEGDIIQDERDKKYLIKWGINSNGFIAKTNETHCNVYSSYHLSFKTIVIGNIYENPELLEVANE